MHMGSSARKLLCPIYIYRTQEFSPFLPCAWSLCKHVINLRCRRWCGTRSEAERKGGAQNSKNFITPQHMKMLSVQKHHRHDLHVHTCTIDTNSFTLSVYLSAVHVLSFLFTCTDVNKPTSWHSVFPAKCHSTSRNCHVGRSRKFSALFYNIHVILFVFYVYGLFDGWMNEWHFMRCVLYMLSSWLGKKFYRPRKVATERGKSHYKRNPLHFIFITIIYFVVLEIK